MEIINKVMEVIVSIYASAVVTMPVFFVLVIISFARLGSRFNKAEKMLNNLASVCLDMVTNSVRVKRLDFKATMLRYKKTADSGADIASIEDVTIEPGKTRKIRTGIAVELPPLYELQVRPRSGLLANGIVAHFGTVDYGYRGEIMVVVSNTTNEPYKVRCGDRIAQAVVKSVPLIEFIEVNSIDTKTDRGSNGFGSTGV